MTYRDKIWDDDKAFAPVILGDQQGYDVERAYALLAEVPQPPVISGDDLEE